MKKFLALSLFLSLTLIQNLAFSEVPTPVPDGAIAPRAGSVPAIPAPSAPGTTPRYPVVQPNGNGEATAIPDAGHQAPAEVAPGAPALSNSSALLQTPGAAASAGGRAAASPVTDKDFVKETSELVKLKLIKPSVPKEALNALEHSDVGGQSAINAVYLMVKWAMSLEAGEKKEAALAECAAFLDQVVDQHKKGHDVTVDDATGTLAAMKGAPGKPTSAAAIAGMARIANLIEQHGVSGAIQQLMKEGLSPIDLAALFSKEMACTRPAAVSAEAYAAMLPVLFAATKDGNLEYKGEKVPVMKNEKDVDSYIAALKKKEEAAQKAGQTNG
jgi:hypothetical protein